MTVEVLGRRVDDDVATQFVISDTVARSVILRVGLAGVSVKTKRVLGRIAARRASMSEASTKSTSTPNLRRKRSANRYGDLKCQLN